METYILKLSFQSLLLLLCDIASFIAVASGCTPGPSFSRTCERGCYYDYVIGFCQPCNQFTEEEAKLRCPELYEATTTVKTTVRATLPVTATTELTNQLPQWVIPSVVVIGLLVLMVITALMVFYRKKLERIIPKRWQRTKNGHDPNIPTAPEGEKMIKPVQETQPTLVV